MKKFLLVFSVCLAVSDVRADVVREIQTSFQSIQTIKTDFDQTVRSSRFGEKKSAGTLVLKRPDQMIWRYENPQGRIFLADGKNITLYDPEEKQVLVTKQPPSSQLPAGFSFLLGSQKLEEIFDIKVVTDAKNSKGIREVVLLCTPKKENAEFKSLELTFQWSPNIKLVVSKIKDLLDAENEIRFDGMKINTQVSTKEFKTSFPKDAPVVIVDGINL